MNIVVVESLDKISKFIQEFENLCIIELIERVVRMIKRKEYEQLIQTTFDVLDSWENKGSETIKLIQLMQETFGVFINYISGHIVDYKDGTGKAPYIETDITIKFILNHTIVEAERIYYDDRQLFVRVADDQRLRRVMIRGIQGIYCRGKMLDLKDKQF